MPGAGPRVLISDLGIYRPDPETFEMTLTSLHAGATVADVRDVTGWDLSVSDDLVETPEPTEVELTLLRRLHASSGTKATD
jgi:glutaconate CoA-transferase subunit B